MGFAALHLHNAFIVCDDIGDATLARTGFQCDSLTSDFPAEFFSNRLLCFSTLPHIVGKPSGFYSGTRTTEHAWNKRGSRIDNQTTCINSSPNIVSGRYILAKTSHFHYDVGSGPQLMLAENLACALGHPT